MSIASERPAEPAAPQLRVLAAPPCEPRYDDEEARRPPAPPGLLALRLAGRRRAETALRLVGTATDGRPPWQPPGGANPGTLATLPPPRLWASRLVQALTEVLAGDRPYRQLMPHLAPRVYAGLERRVTAMPTRTGRTVRAPALPLVRSVHVCEPRPGVAEVSTVVRRGPRMAAIALRLEARDGHWVCTALLVG